MAIARRPNTATPSGASCTPTTCSPRRLLQYLAVAFPQRVWDAFGSWLRTIRPVIPPSELVVANALRHSMPEFLLNSAPSNVFTKFVIERQDTDKTQASSLAA
jgi:hypothetical protein